ncbi:hypothetical protein, partial [Spongiactinospora gelatinilytica]|uniref:hypothetical protein n=1 Tax=Spongiactinospora gelatinilytica TaxID=2666298 RepID=UPI001F2EB5C6
VRANTGLAAAVMVPAARITAAVRPGRTAIVQPTIPCEMRGTEYHCNMDDVAGLLNSVSDVALVCENPQLGLVVCGPAGPLRIRFPEPISPAAR